MDKFASEQRQFLRQASIELQLIEQNDFIKIASIVQKIKNWWKALFDPEFSQRQKEIKDKYNSLKPIVSELLKNLNDLDNAFKNQDPDNVANLISYTPTLIAQVSQELNSMSSSIVAADTAAQQYQKSNISRVQKGYTENKDTVSQLISQLPEELDIKPLIGQFINQPISKFNWFKQFSPEDISFSQNIILNIKKQILSLLTKHVSEQQANEFLNNKLDQIIEQLKFAILNNSSLISYDFKDVSPQIKNLIANQMQFSVNAGPIAVQDVDLILNFPEVVLIDLAASVAPRKQLSVRKVTSISISKIGKTLYANNILTNIVKNAIGNWE